jgi:hypothetical protein
MRPDHCTVDHVLVVIRPRQFRQGLQHGVPYAGHRPSSEPLVDAVPFAVFRRKMSPLRAGAGYPQHTFKKAPIVMCRAATTSALRRQKWRDHSPFFVADTNPFAHRFTSSQDESLNQKNRQSSTFVNRT